MFEVIFATDSAAILGGVGGRGRACLSLQVLQELGRKFSTPCTPAGSGGSKGFAPAAAPTLRLVADWLQRWQDLAGWLAGGWLLAGWLAVSEKECLLPCL